MSPPAAPASPATRAFAARPTGVPASPRRDTGPGDLAAWNARLNRTHAMAALRERGGVLVRGIEARRRRVVARRVLALRHGSVVDAGAEDGWLSDAWASRVDRLTLLDVDPGMLELARARHPTARLVCVDVTDEAALLEALPAGQADVVVASALLEHLPDPRRTLWALARAVRPGGHLVVYLPADRPILLLKRLLRLTRLGRLVRGLSLEPAPGHLWCFRRRDVVRLLRPAGAVEQVSFDPLALGFVGVVRRASA